MRPYTLTDPSGDTVDLDDESIYSHLPSTYEELRRRMLSEIGYALSYMDFLNRNSFPLNDPQRIRVTKLIARFWREGCEVDPEDPECLKRGNVRWLKEQIYIFEDEIENMC